MKQLEALEKKITLIIENSKKLKAENGELKAELKSTTGANAKMEEALLKEHGNVDSLSKEKDSIKVAIEALLENIDKLEEAED